MSAKPVGGTPGGPRYESEWPAVRRAEDWADVRHMSERILHAAMIARFFHAVRGAR